MTLLCGCLAALLLLAASAAAQAGDPALSKLHALLTPLRDPTAIHTDEPLGFWTFNSSGEPLRFAYFAFTPARQILRDWIDASLANAPENVRTGALKARLNAALSNADLFCGRTARDDSPDRCSPEHGDWNAGGFVYPEIEVNRVGRGVLVVRAGLGIECGTDTSAYAYEWREGRWRRIWQDELPIKEGVPYWPRAIESVSVSPADPASGTRLVLALGYMNWCSSAYYPVYFRLWRTYPDGSASKLLFDIEQDGYIGDEPVLSGRVSLHDAYIEFDKSGFDPDYPFYSAVRHFRIDGDTVTRVEPFAFNPRSFVEEWLAADWSESQRWSAPGSALEEWHQKIHALDHDVAFMDRSQRCSADSSLWQASFRLGPDDKPIGEAYFLIRWRPPERFEMVSIDATPRPDCTGDGPAEKEFAPLLPAFLSR